MKLLSIDPSSTRTGLAGFDDFGGDPELVLTDAITPIDVEPWPRVCKIADWVRNHIEGFWPDRVIVELGKKVHGNKRWQTYGAGMSVYGMAVGAVLWEVHKIKGVGRYEIVDANEWTRRGHRQISKTKRNAELELIYPNQYRVKQDPGGDIGDAISMGLWWLEEQRVRGRAS